MNNEPETQQPARDALENPEQDSLYSEEAVTPEVQIVRSNTPRPLSFSQLTTFPVEAPAAPPLPEEPGERGESADEQLDRTPLPLAGAAETAGPEFVWLFEYGPEMDAAYLNSANRLDGLALLYGPAVLKGYTITFDVISTRAGHVAATIVPGRARDAEVWGILYRVPARVTRAQDAGTALLDRIHSAAPPDGLFERIQVTVHEAYRERDISCIAYIASTLARNEYHLLPRQRQTADSAYLQGLVETARKQKLPNEYVQELAVFVASQRGPSEIAVPAAGEVDEHNTEPLPVVGRAAPARTPLPPERGPISSLPWQKGSIIFALYMACALAAALIVTLIEGSTLGSSMLTASFIPPGVPWFILMYGFMGGCLSCIVTLGRYQAAFPPNFILITWFTRPFVGAVLAVIAFLLLNSGLFMLSGGAAQHNALFSLLAVVAGSCEGWLFYRRK